MRQVGITALVTKVLAAVESVKQKKVKQKQLKIACTKDSGSIPSFLIN